MATVYVRKDTQQEFQPSTATPPQGCYEVVYDEETGEVISSTDMCLLMPGYKPYPNSVAVETEPNVGVWEDQTDYGAINSATAKAEQDIAVKAILEDNQREALGLVPLMDNASRLDQENYVQLMQGQIDNPTTDPVYNPPLPPGVVPPEHETLTVAVVRTEGWQGALGWTATITSMAESFVPTNLAMAWYNNPDCDGYVGTSGAFVQNAETGMWEGVCPAGFEPGDADINFGLLYGSAELACFTLLAGVETKVFNVYDPEEA